VVSHSNDAPPGDFKLHHVSGFVGQKGGPFNRTGQLGIPWQISMQVMIAPPRTLAFSEAKAHAPQAVSVEAELVSRSLRGEGSAFSSLVSPHLPLLYRIAHRACRSSALAEDAVQETLTIAFRKLGHYEPGTSLKAFLGAIATRQALTLLRSERRRQWREEKSAAPVDAVTPVEELTAKRLAERIRLALAGMPKKRQEVALLRLDAHMSYLEIAVATGTTEGSARVLVHLAVKELREKLADLLIDE